MLMNNSRPLIGHPTRTRIGSIFTTPQA